MKIAIAGATGMIGSCLTEKLRDNGHSLLLFTRKPNPPLGLDDQPEISWVRADLDREVPSGALDGIDALVNLAGTRIRGGRWSRSHKKDIYNSRINITRNLVRAMRQIGSPPGVFVSASATGFYGDRGNEILTEDSGSGEGFLAGVTNDWEAEARQAEAIGARVVLLRSAPVLCARDGAIPEIIKSFKMGFGGALGPGTQWMPWIHIEDEALLIAWALENHLVRGALNASSPDPRTNHDFMGAIAENLGKHLLMNVPSAVLKLALGEMAREMLLSSQRVMPEKALNSGYTFKFSTLEQALRDLL